MKFGYIILTFLLLFAFSGCNTAWDKYFDQVGEYEGEAVSPLNLLEYLETQESYSKFVDLLKKTKLDSVLTKNQVLTVWAIPNEAIPVEIEMMDEATLVQFMKNHLNNVALYKSTLENGRSVHTLAGKILKLGYEDKVYTLDKVEITRMNQICKNGVVHELKDGVLTPKKNIYEYMMSLGDECSIFRDTLCAYNDTLFDREASLPIGENEWGNTVYDSVFYIENPFFIRGDIRDEENELTFFLPTNDAMKTMLINVSNFFAQAKREFTAADTNKIMTWLLKSVIHRGRLNSYPTGVSLFSVFSSEWRTDKEFVKEDYESCSNGNVYIVTTLVFPRKEYMERIEIRPYYVFTLPKDKQAEMVQASEGVKLSLWGNVDKGHDLFNVSIPAKNKDAWVTFQAIARNSRGQVEAMKVMPGIYRLSTSFRSYACGKIALYAVYDDGGQEAEEKILEFNPTDKMDANKKTGTYYYIPISEAGVKNPKGGFNGLLKADFEVKPEWGYSYLRFKMVNIGGSDRMTPEYFLLDPTNDNY